LDNNGKNELFGKEIKIKRKFITSSASPFNFDDWQHPADAATAIKAEKQPTAKPTVPRTQKKTTIDVTTPLTSVTIRPESYTKLS